MRSFAPLFRADARACWCSVACPARPRSPLPQYYAHPRNAFWPIMGALFGRRSGTPYAQRLEAPRRRRRRAVGRHRPLRARRQPLDSAIAPDSIEGNDFAGLFCPRPDIGSMSFNGTAAGTAFRRHVRPHRAAAAALHPPALDQPGARRARAGRLAAWQVVKAAAHRAAAARIDIPRPGRLTIIRPSYLSPRMSVFTPVP